MKSVPVDFFTSRGLAERYLRGVKLPPGLNSLVSIYLTQFGPRCHFGGKSWAYISGRPERSLGGIHEILKGISWWTSDFYLTDVRTLTNLYLRDQDEFERISGCAVAGANLLMDGFNKMELKAVEMFLEARHSSDRPTVIAAPFPITGDADCFENHFGPTLAASVREVVGRFVYKEKK